MSDLLDHLTQRAEHLRVLSALVASFDSLKPRQRSLLEHAIRHPREGHSIEGHAASHAVHYMTARADLADLEDRGLLQSRRQKTIKRYYPSPKLLSSAAPNAGRVRVRRKT